MGPTLALMNAGIPMLDFVCAVSGGVHSTAPLLDLTLLEENDVPNVTIAVMPKTKKSLVGDDGDKTSRRPVRGNLPISRRRWLGSSQGNESCHLGTVKEPDGVNRAGRSTEWNYC